MANVIYCRVSIETKIKVIKTWNIGLKVLVCFKHMTSMAAVPTYGKSRKIHTQKIAFLSHILENNLNKMSHVLLRFHSLCMYTAYICRSRSIGYLRNEINTYVHVALDFLTVDHTGNLVQR